uniref:Uncharacterized protein n=1 Tax=uncultured marine virus TaxID=186617 RepID=A0A0F7LBG7_9VIRU|nr:hypothetical protein [uncultured marine virus]
MTNRFHTINILATLIGLNHVKSYYLLGVSTIFSFFSLLNFRTPFKVITSFSISLNFWCVIPFHYLANPI